MESNKSAKLWNGRYIPIKEIGDGAFSVVYLCEDTMPCAEPRLLSAETIAHINLIAMTPPEVEFVEREAPSEEHKQSVNFLSNLDKVFPQNNKFIAQQ
jgi:serine/threonine protein kinase